MKNIEEILHKMKELNPDIKMDEKFRNFLKNKLEVTAYSKIKNTQNKKINIAKSGFFSFWKNNSNIFEKPKFNFIKFLSPIFIGAFAVFGFINFYGTDLFINNEEIIKSVSNELYSEKEIGIDDEIIKTVNKEDRQVKSINIQKQKTIINKKPIKKTESSPIKNIPVIPKTKNIIQEVDSEEIIIQENKKQINNNTSVNTEIIDLLGNEDVENINNNDKNFDMGNVPEIVDGGLMDGFESNDTVATENTEIFSNNGDFEDFCNTKNGKIENNICSYGEKKCSLEEFRNNKCDKK